MLVLRRNALAADGVAKEVSRVWFCSDAYELVCTTRVPSRKRLHHPHVARALTIATHRTGETHGMNGSFSAQPHSRRRRGILAIGHKAAPPRKASADHGALHGAAEDAGDHAGRARGREGFFKEAGIDAKTVTVAHGPAAVTALASGSVDVATNAPEVFLALAGKGQSLKLIAGQSRQLGVLAVRPGLDVPANFPDSVQALKGKKIGVTALSSATQYLAIAMLNAAGLDATDVEFIAVGAGAPQALVARHVDAGC